MQDKILEILLNNSEYISGEDISSSLNVSRQAVWKAINALKKQGFVIDSVTNKGYKLIDQPKALNKQMLDNILETEFIGRNMIVLETVGSTNEYLKSLGHKGLAHGTVATAREQTAGKGRLGRKWVSKKDENIYFSVLLRPELSPMEVSGITPVAGLAVCKAIREFCNIDCKIKWPNDVIISNKKLVGILTEMSAEFDAVDFIVIGIGINLDQAEFPEEVKNKATSIFIETGKKPDKNKFLALVLKHLETELTKSNYKINETNLEDYKNLCATIGRKVTCRKNNGEIQGTAVNVNNNGELEVKAEDNSLITVNSGEVVIQGIY